MTALELSAAEAIQNSIDHIVQEPERFALVHTENVSSLRTEAAKATHALYSLEKQVEPYKMSPFDDISFMMMEEAGFDLEQIWELMQMQNGPMLNYLNKRVDQVIEMEDISDLGEEPDELMEECTGEEESFDDDLEGSEEGNVTAQDESENAVDKDVAPGDDEAEDIMSEEDEKRNPSLLSSQPYPKTQVDDDFFSVRQMEEFAQLAEKWDHRQGLRQIQEHEENEDSADELQKEFDLGLDFLGQDLEEDQDLDDIMYEDFFGPKEKQEARIEQPVKRTREMAELEYDEEGYYNEDEEQVSQPSSEDETCADHQDENNSMTVDSMPVKSNSHSLLDDDPVNETHSLSTFEKQQQKLTQQIQQLEEEAVAEKSWAMKGEAASKDRPLNAILEEDLQVDYASKPVPVVTEETTQTLEDLIKSRIRDGLFDDVERKIPPPDRSFDPNKRIELDGEKSKTSLSEIYEKEYNRQTSTGPIQTEKDVKLQAAHQEIEDLFKTLCLQLDALSNSHYTPPVPQAEVTVIPTAISTPAISMEESLPTMVSDAATLAPQEVFEGSIQPSQMEMSSKDKKRELLKARKKARIEQRERDMHRKAIEQVKQSKGIVSKETEKQGKVKAMKELKKHDNVTIITHSASKPEKKKSKAGYKMDQDKLSFNPSMLRL